MEEKRTTLTAAEYWEWMTTIRDLRNSENYIKIAQLEHKLLLKDAELLGVRAQLFLRTKLDAAQQAKDSAQKEYERYKKVLEESLGYSLNEKMIDDLTFEVKDIPKDN